MNLLNKIVGYGYVAPTMDRKSSGLACQVEYDLDYFRGGFLIPTLASMAAHSALGNIYSKAVDTKSLTSLFIISSLPLLTNTLSLGYEYLRTKYFQNIKRA